MRIPTKMNFNNEFYDTIGLFTINKTNFLIIKKDSNIIEIDTDIDNDNLSFKIPTSLKDSNNTSEHILVNYLIEVLKEEVSEKAISSNEELKKTLDDFIIFINNSDVNQILTSCNNEIKNGDFNQNIISLLEYFEKKFEDNNILDFNKLDLFTLDNTNYIRYKSDKNEVKIVIDTPDNRTFVENLKSKVEDNPNIPDVKILNSDDLKGTDNINDNTTDNTDNEQNIPDNVIEEKVQSEEQVSNKNDDNPIDETINDNLNSNVEEDKKDVSSNLNQNEIKENITSENKDVSKKKKKLNMADILILLLIVGIICGIYLIYLIITVI